MSDNRKIQLLEELEDQFHSVQTKITKARDEYLAAHEKDYQKAKQAYEKTRKRLQEARKTVTSEAEKARKSGTTKAQNSLKKARAVAMVPQRASSAARARWG